MMIKSLTTSVLLLCLVACTGVSSTPAPEPAPEEAAARLIRLSMSERLAGTVADNYRGMLASMMAEETDDPERVMAIVDAELESLRAEARQRLTSRLVPVYLEYFSPGEIRELLRFYESEVARKSQRLGSQIAADTQPLIRAWSEAFGELLLARVAERLQQEGIEVRN